MSALLEHRAGWDGGWVARTYRGLAVVLVLGLIGLGLGCGGSGSRVSDTGLVGSWARGDAVVSLIYIVPDESGDYRFRLGIDDREQEKEMRCDWEGNCTRLVNRDPVATYRFQTRPDAAERGLIVEYDVTTDTHTMHYTDLLIVEPGGLSLTVKTIERDGEEFELERASTRVFRKISDEVPGAPEEAG